MGRAIFRHVVTAKKDHQCMASFWWLRYGLRMDELETDEDRHIVQMARVDGWVVKAGQPCLVIVVVDGGEIERYRARPDMQELIERLVLLDDEL